MNSVAPEKDLVHSTTGAPSLKQGIGKVQIIDRGQRDRFAPAIASLEEGVRAGAFPGAVLGIVQSGSISLLVGRGIRWSAGLLSASGGGAFTSCSVSGSSVSGSSVSGRSVSGRSVAGAEFLNSEKLNADDLHSGADANQTDFNTIYDLGTLTSAVLTIPLMMRVVGTGKIRLEDRVTRYLQGFGVHGKSSVTIEQLLCHAAGFPMTAPFFEELALASGGERIGILTTRGAKQFVYTALHRFEPRYVPGSKRVWSELSAIVLGELLETLTGTTLERLAQKELFQPLGMRSTSFVDLGMMNRRGIHPVRDMIAPTDDCSWRKRVMCGEVLNENAWAMGGIAGHAGLFSSARDVCSMALEFIRALNGRGSVLNAQTVHRFVAPTREQDTGVRLGFESPSKENGLIDSGLSSDAFGATSDTGCSMWIDRSREIGVVLLTNRIDPTRSNKPLKTARAAITREVLSCLG